MKGKLFAISGPGGVGKRTIAKIIIENPNLKIHKITTYTTRPKRPDEEEGVERHFLTVGEFQKLDKSGGLVAKKFFINHWYGTPKKELDETLMREESVLLEIDVSGIQKIKKQYPETIAIFIYSPLAEIEKRLIARGHNTLNEIREKLEIAKLEIAYKENYDYTVENPPGHPAIAAQKIIEIIKHQNQ